jgi:hypothetical protein
VLKKPEFAVYANGAVVFLAVSTYTSTPGEPGEACSTTKLDPGLIGNSVFSHELRSTAPAIVIKAIDANFIIVVLND